MSTTTRLLTSLAASLALLSVGSGAASADTAVVHARTDNFHRPGLFVGASLGTGSLVFEDCSDCSADGASIDLHVGWLMTPRLAFTLERSAVISADSEVALAHEVDSFGVQYWFTPRFWARSGAGLAVLSVSDDNQLVSERYGKAGTLSLGVELLHRRTHSLDLQVRASNAVFESQKNIFSAAVAVGFNWY